MTDCEASWRGELSALRDGRSGHGQETGMCMAKRMRKVQASACMAAGSNDVKVRGACATPPMATGSVRAGRAMLAVHEERLVVRHLVVSTTKASTSRSKP